MTKRGIREKEPIFPGLTEREKRREPKDSFQDLRSSIGQFSSGQERKFIASTRVHKIRERRFREIKVFGLRKLPARVSTLQGVRDSSYLGLLSIFRPGKEGFSFKGVFGKEKLGFQVLPDVSSPRQTKGVNLLKEDWFFA